MPSLLHLAAEAAAQRPHALTPAHLLALGEDLTALLLATVARRLRLDYYVAEAFLATGYPSVVEALQELDLAAGLTGVAPTACRPSR